MSQIQEFFQYLSDLGADESDQEYLLNAYGEFTCQYSVDEFFAWADSAADSDTYTDPHTVVMAISRFYDADHSHRQ